MPQTIREGAVFSLALVFGNILNFIFYLYLGRHLTPGDFSLVAVFLALLTTASVFLNALSSSVGHGVGWYGGRPETSGFFFFRTWGKQVAAFAGILSVVWLAALPVLARIWETGAVPLMFFLPIFLFGGLTFLLRGIFQGGLYFAIAGIIFFSESLFKLIGAVMFTVWGLAPLAYLSIPISVILSCFLGLFFLWKVRAGNLPQENITKDSIPFPSAFFFFTVLLGLTTLTFLTFDIFLAKAFFDPETAGAYALITLCGKMLFFSGSLLSAVMISVISNFTREGKDTRGIFRWLLAATVAFVTLGAVFFIFFGKWFFTAIYGSKVAAVLPLLPWYIFAMTGFTISYTVVLYHHAKKEFQFTFAALLSALIFFVGTLVFHHRIGEFLLVFFFTALLHTVTIFSMHFFRAFQERAALQKEERERAEYISRSEAARVPTPPRVSVGISALNEEKNIKEFLQSILHQRQEHFVLDKIFLFSDGSTDGTVREAASLGSHKIIILDEKMRRGKAARVNQFFQLTSADVAVVFDADIQLGNDMVLENLTRPIVLGEADFTSALPTPTPPRTLIEKALYAGCRLKYAVYLSYAGGNNRYTCYGAQRAFHQKLYKKLNIVERPGEDVYSFLFSKKNGFKYGYARGVLTYFTLPDNFSDHLKQGIRVMQNQTRHRDIFGEELVKKESYLPKFLVVKEFFKTFFQFPFSLFLYVAIFFVTWLMAKRTPATTTLWKTIESSKK
ncbi:MAG TPA: glycosyltransferase [Candidatus Paceibacterota bacterium]|nr:glycosyltransferase [Candidatus Paceibacterota bacterium]